MRRLLSIALAVVLPLGCESRAERKDSTSSEPLRATFYLMSRCPFAAEMLPPLLELKRALGADMALELRYVGRTDAGALGSFYGAQGVTGDTVQLCVRQVATESAWLDFLSCQAADAEHLPSNWSSCAERAGVPAEPLQACVAGPLGASLARASYELSKSLDVGGSPTLVLDGETYGGGRRYLHLAREICRRLKRSPPEVCRQIPEPPAVGVTLLQDARCTTPDCDVTRFLRFLELEFPGAKVERLDVATERGQALLARAGATHLPLAVFDERAPTEVVGFRKLAPHAREVPGLGHIFELGQQVSR